MKVQIYVNIIIQNPKRNVKNVIDYSRELTGIIQKILTVIRIIQSLFMAMNIKEKHLENLLIKKDTNKS